MDVAPRVDRLLSRAVDEQVNEQRSLRKALEALVGRVARVEDTMLALEEKVRPWSDPGAATADLALRVEDQVGRRLDALEDRLDELALALEERAVDSLSADVSAVAEELRKAVGELGRMLLRDRGRISNALTEHRNAILAELRLPASDQFDDDVYDDDLDDDHDEEDDEEAVLRARPFRRLRVK